MPTRDDLDALIDELAEDDPGLRLRFAAALARFESGADTRLPTVARHAAALGVAVTWSIRPVAPPARDKQVVRPWRKHGVLPV